MRILLVHQYYLEPDDAGGSRWNQMARYWAEQGHEITVLAGTVHYATGRKAPQYKGRFVVTRQEAPGIRVSRCHVSESYNRSFAGRLWAYISFAVSSTYAALTQPRPDVIVCTSPPLTVGLTGAVLQRWWRVPMVFEVRDLWPESSIEAGVLTNPLLIRLSYMLERLSYKHANWINVLTPAFRDHLTERKGVDPARISTITNAADLDVFHPGPRENHVRERFGLQGKFVIIYVGAHGVANHLEQLVDAAAALRDQEDVHFLLVGDGMRKSFLREEAKRRGLSNITFADPVPKQEIADYIAAADVCTAVLKRLDVFKTVYPNKLFDYMASQRPVILGIDGVARRLLEEAGAGLYVQPEDPEALAEAVQRLRGDRALGERFAVSGRRFVEQHYARDVLARKYLNIIETKVRAHSLARAVLS